MSNILDKISLYLLILIPLTLISGPFLPDLFLSIIVIIFLYKIFKYNEWDKIKNKYFIILSGICIYLIIGSIRSENIFLSLKPTLFYFRFGIFCFAVYYLMEKYSEKIIQNLFIIILFILSLLLFSQTYDLIFQKNIITGEFNDEFRHTGFFGDDEIIGSYVARLFPFFLYIFLEKKRENKKIIFSFIIIVSLIIFLSSERTSFFFFLLASIIFIFLSKKDLRNIFLKVFLFLVVVLSIFFVFKSDFKQRVNQTFNQIFLSENGKTEIVIFSKVHESHYQIAYKMFKEKPLFGHGVKIFRHYCGKSENYINDYACTTHPHNVFMQLLAETGIVFTVLTYSFYLFLIFQLLKIFYKKNFIQNYEIEYSKVCLLVSLFITLFPFSPSGNFFDNWLSIVYYYPIGIYLWKMNSKNY